MNRIKPTTWVILGYFLIFIVAMAFVWKYQPMWKSILIGLWAIVSWVVGFITAWRRYKSKDNKIE